MPLSVKAIALSFLVLSLMTGCDAHDNQGAEPRIDITEPALGARLSLGALFPVMARITSNQAPTRIHVGLYHSKISTRDTLAFVELHNAGSAQEYVLDVQLRVPNAIAQRQPAESFFLGISAGALSVERQVVIE